MISIVIPARNEELNIVQTLKSVLRAVPGCEVVVVDDGSTDRTMELAETYCHRVISTAPRGIGCAIREGIRWSRGDKVIVVMADGSDDPRDIKRMAEIDGCVFGDRWNGGATIENYPTLKFFLNRFFNHATAFLFGLDYYDITNAFKSYTREALNAVDLTSTGFEITVELPLKVIRAGFPFKVIPTNWSGRKHGKSGFRIKEIGSKYLSVIWQIWLKNK